jgi:hypothetical protein
MDHAEHSRVGHNHPYELELEQQSETDATRSKDQNKKTSRPMPVRRVISTTERSRTARHELRIVGDEPRRQINACGQHTLLGDKKLVGITTTGSWTWQATPWRPIKSSG